MRSYETARTLFKFLAFCAWTVVVLGVIVALLGAGSVSQYASGGAGLLAMVPGLGIALAGLLLVAFVQIGRANVDTAEYTQQMLKISRDQLEVSKQSLKQDDTFQKNYASLKMETQDAPKDEAFSPKTHKTAVVNKIDANITEYKGMLITKSNDTYFCNEIPFSKLQSAKKYIDDNATALIPAQKS